MTNRWPPSPGPMLGNCRADLRPKRSQQDVAGGLDKSRSFVQSIEKDGSNPTWQTIAEYCAEIGIGPLELALLAEGLPAEWAERIRAGDLEASQPPALSEKDAQLLKDAAENLLRVADSVSQKR